MGKIFSLAALAFTTLLAHAQLSIDTTTASDWKISNGTLTLNFDSSTGHVWSLYLNSTNLVDTTYLGSDGNPDGLYMDNSGFGTGTGTASYHLDSGHYLDWWITVPSSSTNAFTYTQHWFLLPNDATLYVYFVAAHSATDISGSVGQVQWVFRVSPTLFTNTYSVNSGLNNTGATTITLPSASVLGTTDTGRAVQDATTDLHGLTIPSGFGREFYTKYDYSSYEYLHKGHGVYGSTYGAWTTIPSTETLSGGPTKQDLIFTESIIMAEAFSDHLDNELAYTPTQDVASSRFYGPFGFHFNAFTSSLTTSAQLYSEAQSNATTGQSLFDSQATLVSNGYVPRTTSYRGTVKATITDGGSSTANNAWVVLGDNEKNFQYSSSGLQYWAANSAGIVTLSDVAPGTYRLSGYVLGKFGEYRSDDVKVTAGNTTSVTGTFTEEKFGSSSPIWTIGTPDRSAHEFQHGKNSSGYDDREYWGNWNYWSDFASNSGAVVYYATAVGATDATANLSKWNYCQWGEFDPGIFGGYYSSSDDTTDGYDYIIPSYVADLSTTSGTDGVTTSVPAWDVYFTATSDQLAQGSYVALSIGLAATEASVTATLNGHKLVWSGINKSDAMVRSGLSGYYQWVVFQWPVADLSAAEDSNLLTLQVSQADGVEYDALRMEITDTSASPATTGWHDYEYVDSSGYTAADDTVANN
ncbi:polysaccharide lyase family protein [Telmatobacter bradus]|uniref:polysaccharide lyase family protein n=1 Tax=Telmatobacter bradus TaxID=474953 RepID=UPI003B43D5A5